MRWENVVCQECFRNRDTQAMIAADLMIHGIPSLWYRDPSPLIVLQTTFFMSDRYYFWPVWNSNTCSLRMANTWIVVTREFIFRKCTESGECGQHTQLKHNHRAASIHFLSLMSDQRPSLLSLNAKWHPHWGEKDRGRKGLNIQDTTPPIASTLHNTRHKSRKYDLLFPSPDYAGQTCRRGKLS